MTQYSCILIRTQEILIKKIIKNRTKDFLKDECAEIERYKWIKSQKAKKDLGNNCCLEWIEKYAKEYREQWEEKNGKIIEEIEVDDE